MFELNLFNVAFLLVVVGAINWGLVALNNIDLVKIATMNKPQIEKIVKLLVGAAGGIVALAMISKEPSIVPQL